MLLTGTDVDGPGASSLRCWRNRAAGAAASTSEITNALVSTKEKS